MTRPVRAAGLTAAVLASALIATGGTAVAAPSHHRGTVTLHTTRAHKVHAPARTRPGVARINNTGRQPVLLARARHGAGASTLAHDLNAETARGLIKHFTVTEAPASAVTYLHLARGSYYLADLSRESFSAASIKTLRVAGSTVSATVPKHRTFVVTHRGTLRAPANIGTSSEIQIRNTSTHLQELWLWAVPTSVTAEALNAFVAKPSFEKLYGLVTGLPDVLTIMSPQNRATSSHHSKAGRYLLMTITLTSNTTDPRLSAGRVRVVTAG